MLAIIVWGRASKSKHLDGALGATLDLLYDTNGAKYKGDSHSLPPGAAAFGRRRGGRR